MKYKVKTITQYEKLLESYSLDNLRKMKRLVTAISDEGEWLPKKIPEGLVCPIQLYKEQLEKFGFSLDEAIDLFSNLVRKFKLFMPPRSVDEIAGETISALGEKKQCLIITPFSSDNPYGRNIFNFTKAINNMITTKSKEKSSAQKVLKLPLLHKPSQFKKNPPRIIWMNKEILIPSDTKQFCACRILFKKSPGENVYWDEIMEEIRGEKDFNKDEWREVYDAVCAINKKVKEKVRKKLFKTSRKSFCRIA